MKHLKKHYWIVVDKIANVCATTTHDIPYLYHTKEEALSDCLSDIEVPIKITISF